MCWPRSADLWVRTRVRVGDGDDTCLAVVLAVRGVCAVWLWCVDLSLYIIYEAPEALNQPEAEHDQGPHTYRIRL